MLALPSNTCATLLGSIAAVVARRSIVAYENNEEDSSSARAHRRKLLKTVAAGGSALSLITLPGRWSKPVVASVILPAHAQTSQAPVSKACEGTLANCPGAPSTSTVVFATVKTVTVASYTNAHGGLAYNGTLYGVDAHSSSSYLGICPSPCDQFGMYGYSVSSLSFGGGTMTRENINETRCGDEPVFRLYYRFVGTESATATGSVRVYTGSGTAGTVECA